MMVGQVDTIIFSRDGIRDGFLISQETLDHLDPVKRALGTELIRQGRWHLLPAENVGFFSPEAIVR
jgi:hypothetical protein